MSYYKGKKIFVSGGAGVIGTVLVDMLLAEGAQVFVGDLKKQPAAFKGKVSYREGDLNSLTKKELLAFAPQLYFHLAATFERSTESYDFWEENDRHNTRLSHHLLDLIRECPALERIVFASSYLIYDPAQYLFDKPRAAPVSLKESSPLQPRNLCGMAKYYHEKELEFIESFSNGRLSVASARIFRSFGRGSKDIVSRWVRALLNQEPIEAFALEGLFDYIYADDAARGLMKLAESQASGVFNLGSGRARRVQEVIEMLKKHFPLMDLRLKDSAIPYEASQADMSRFKAVAGWEPQVSLEEGIANIVAFEKSKNH